MCIFVVGKGSCNLCHFGPNFTHGEFHEVGIPVFRKSGGTDGGRYDGIKVLRAGRLTLLGQYSDDPVRHDSNIDPGKLHLAHLYDNKGLSLAVVTGTLLKPLGLSEQEMADVAAFLQTLSDSENAMPRKPPVAANCR